MCPVFLLESNQFCSIECRVDRANLSRFYFDFSNRFSLDEQTSYIDETMLPFLALQSTKMGFYLSCFRNKGKQDTRHSSDFWMVLQCPVFSVSKNRTDSSIYGKTTLKTGHCCTIQKSLLCPVFRSLSGFPVFRDAPFPTIFVLLEMTCLVTLIDHKLLVFQKVAKLTILGIFNQLLSTKNVNVFLCS